MNIARKERTPMKNENDHTPTPQTTPQENKLPTAFELAELATRVPTMWREMDALIQNPAPRRSLTSYKRAVYEALSLWEHAAEAVRNLREADQQLKELFDGMFTMTHDEWNARAKDYKGEKADLTRALWGMEYPTEEVRDNLYKDKSMSRKSKGECLVGLVDFGLKQGIEFFGPRQVKTANQLREDLSRPTISAQFCRWIVSARQKQKAINKARDYVPTRHGGWRKSDDSIQYKRSFKAK